MGPVSLVLVLMLGHVNGIGKGKYDRMLVATYVVLPGLLSLMLLCELELLVVKLFGSEVVFILLPLYPLSIGGTQRDI